VRALVSARNSPMAWDLRCEIREQIIEWLRAEYPEALPRVRAYLEDGPPVGAKHGPSLEDVLSRSPAGS
jgi:hypothetical protein